jgi:hypothetical protein
MKYLHITLYLLAISGDARRSTYTIVTGGGDPPSGEKLVTT